MAPVVSFAGNSEWVDGVYTGSAADFFAGQPTQVIAFVNAHSDLAARAQNYLSQCPADDVDGVCTLNQTRFILDYIAAFYNDHSAQQNVAYVLSGDGGQTNPQTGISPNHLWGCAWSIATLTSGSSDVTIGDLSDYKEDCEALSSHDQGQAYATASGYLTPAIHDYSAHGKIQYDLVDNFPYPPQ